MAVLASRNRALHASKNLLGSNASSSTAVSQEQFSGSFERKTREISGFVELSCSASTV
jgi:hypothetical protein